MCGPKFCSMQITRDLREEAAALSPREKGMAEKSAEFLEKGAEIYVAGMGGARPRPAPAVVAPAAGHEPAWE